MESNCSHLRVKPWAGALLMDICFNHLIARQESERSQSDRERGPCFGPVWANLNHFAKKPVECGRANALA
jgi:hypothetical protein